jgi:hypothetical protein
MHLINKAKELRMEEKVVGNAPETTVSDSTQETSDVVSYETHKKLLGQRKKDLERLGSMEAELESIRKEKAREEEEKLTEQGKYKELLAKKEAELDEVRTRELAREKDLMDAHKLNAFREKLPSRIIHPDYYSHVNLDSIKLDSETRTIDDSSLNDTVNLFLKNHSSLLEKSDSKELPNQAPQGTGPRTLDQMTRAERLQLVLNKHK